MGNDRATAQFLLKHFSDLELFLTKHHKRFAEDPRQIANAMAGRPELPVLSSLKRCQQLPYELTIDERAMKAYIRRKHPELYKQVSTELKRAKPYVKFSKDPCSPQLANIRKQYRTKDETMRNVRAVDLERFWAAATARSKLEWIRAVSLTQSEFNRR